MNFYVFFGESTGIDLGSVQDMIEKKEKPNSGIAPELIAEARRELKRAEEMYPADKKLAAEICRTAFLSARSLRFALESRPAVKQVRAMHASPRPSKRPLMDSWIKECPGKTARELWDSIPNAGDRLFRDDERVYEDTSDKKGVGFKYFENRVSELRNPG